MKTPSLDLLLQQIKACTICQEHLPMGTNPVVRASTTARILIIGQAPGIRVHRSGIPWDDPSGDRLRTWMDVDKDTFYDESKIAIVPMGFCYPGTGKGGDLPPRKECAPQWHHQLLQAMPNLELTLLIGTYAQKYYLKKRALKNLTTTVQHYTTYLPEYFPLVHPSPRNRYWVSRNPWFEAEVIPALRERIASILVI